MPFERRNREDGAWGKIRGGSEGGLKGGEQARSIALTSPSIRAKHTW
jgi:hypothetical protein